MTNILQNVTKDNILLQLKRTVIGAAIVAPFAGFVAFIAYLVTNGYLNATVIYVAFQTAMVCLVFWSLGGAYEAYKNMKRFQQEHEDRKTQKAFEKLSNGNT